MRRTLSENTDHSNGSAGSNRTHRSDEEHASQISAVPTFDYSLPGYVNGSQDADDFVASVGSQYQGVDEGTASYVAARTSGYSPASTSEYTQTAASGYTRAPASEHAEYAEYAEYTEYPQTTASEYFTAQAADYSPAPASEHTQAGASAPLLDSIEGDEAAAYEASMYAQQILSQTTYRTPRFSMIRGEDVDETLGELQRRDPAATDREAIQAALQRFLSRYLSRHTRGTDRDQAKITNALREAAFQLQLRIQGEEALNICYFAIAAVLASLRDENPRAQLTTGSSSTMVQATAGSQRFVCGVHDCTQGAFGRAADLERHHKMVHLPDDEKKKFFCDYRRCSRHDSPFYRQDHFRDHLRDFHKEDLLRRGNRADEKWWTSRSSNAINNGWWRCNRCLVTRVDIQRDGWVCPHCAMHCETDRQRVRTQTQR
ncbi:hypothetical protein QBC37DRAFT_291002 [Rhypophila decipiens]|uniref:C2H2-type domain-containing protein n=1 Tax=Rhypophila decipiens TaxID=261697 RepID=A0AAN7B379_9PEZI|nr:hypothetical protein QBC37DRAFT_291002 [Rhypophila decipiens]